VVKIKFNSYPQAFFGLINHLKAAENDFFGNQAVCRADPMDFRRCLTAGLPFRFTMILHFEDIIWKLPQPRFF
jgi:hypothetical protein